MESQGNYRDELPRQAVFALDIGTRSIIGMVGVPDGDRMQIVAIEQIEHTKRAMIDGQIENIDQVAKVAAMVKERLEKKLGCKLSRVAVAAAGRSLRTESVSFEMALAQVRRIDAELVSRLEAGAISEAEKAFFSREPEENEQRFYLVGYSVSRYYLDDYILSSLVDHNGRVLKADVIATFLPSEVVESLYAAMHKIDLEISSLTLEPIAAINAAIPPGIRLLNLALVDIGAGTSDIAVCRDGYITGYTMAVQAGDELTESIMKTYLVDFATAERIKFAVGGTEPIRYIDIMGFEQTLTREELAKGMKPAVDSLCEEICKKILEANGGVPSAVFLAGGGSLFPGLPEGIVERLHMDAKRVAIAGRNFGANAWSDEYELENPEYATPLGIVISAGLNMINDSFRIFLNGEPAKLFRSGTFTVMNILMMNGYSYQDMMGKSGQNLVVRLNGQRQVFYGEKAEPCILRLNGEDAQLSDMVRAGDQLTFTPVQHGTDAEAMLSELVDLTEDSVVTVNGKKARADMPLKNGDVILVEGMYVWEELSEEEQAAAQGRKARVSAKREQKPARIKPEKAAASRKRTAPSSSRTGTGRTKASAQPAGERKRGRPAGVKAGAAKEGRPEPSNAAAAVRHEPESPSPVQIAQSRPEPLNSAAAVRHEPELASPAQSIPSQPEQRSAAAVVRRDPEQPSPAQNAQSRPEPSNAAAVPRGPELPSPAQPPQHQPEPSNAAAVPRGPELSSPAQPPQSRPQSPSPTPAVQSQPSSSYTAPSHTALAGLRAVRPFGQPETKKQGKLMLYLNERTLVLPPKADGQPYFLMDMLEYSGLDLEKVAAPVVLEVNGVSGSFQQELKTGDSVRIYEQR